ncbi:16S rRNA (guanine(966)-N(2))-methyltransferase RsmD [Antrihabitans stalactiti]|uniref:16S rRNA (Guanine(966)-N(2))-methyltransferase RsmD n=1 Tax=Antrihabitans stalactiti TaxID=2584121 RepID=A0A848K7M8_9NOCA|nr:16S rRNA (guanine(966)-N(2))-methyltransferase RsmD [Antrihabitans stalactiti]NMN94369.1 16S rRNA (guanine(966)-N(2))-methyltransferase RsmD [Antrihabitans stalactiti]
MTRIIAGSAGGRKLRVPPAGTRPTSDRVREALFNTLASRIDFAGTRVLDLYAGSGAVGLEALSRGAVHALLVESDGRAAAIIKSNIADIGVEGARVVTATVASVLRHPPEQPYDLVFADPPYDVPADVVENDLSALDANGWLADEGIAVIERSIRSPETRWPEGFLALPARKYGETRIDLAYREGVEPVG